MVSVDSAEQQGPGASDTPAASADGMYVAFFSVNDLAPGADDGVYVRDVSKGTTVWASDPAEVGAPGRAHFPTISGDGRLVAFDYTVDGQVTEDVYVHDRDADQDGIFDEPGAMSATLVSVGAEGGKSYRPYISSDGRYVAFTSTSAITAADNDAGKADVYRRDLLTNTTAIVSVPGVPGADDDAQATSISANGQYVAFDGDGTNLVAGDMNGATDVFVRDMDASTTTLASTGKNGQANAQSFQGSLSGDGSLVAFTTTADNFSDDNKTPSWAPEDVYVRDLTYGTTNLVSTNTTGGAADGRSRFPAMSLDGGRVAFASEATNLVKDDTEGNPDVFVRALSRATQTDGRYVEHTIVLKPTIRVSVKGTVGGDRASGMGFNDKFFRAPTISSNGFKVAFTTLASNLTSSDTNGKTTDVLLRYTGAA
jgi:Tol biopolymer transport system component